MNHHVQQEPSKMRRLFGSQININTLLITIIGVLLAFSLRKADEVMTQVIELKATTVTIATRQTALERKLEEVVMKSEFNSTIRGLRNEIDGLRRSTAKTNP